MPDFLQHVSAQLRIAGRQLRILHDYHVTQPLSSCLISSLQQETTEALAIVCNDAWAGVPFTHGQESCRTPQISIHVELTSQAVCACSRPAR